MAASTEVKIFTKPKKVCKAVAREIRKMTEGSPRPRFDIALSGGNTPKKLFKILAKKHKDTIPWEHIHFWWGDERCVSPTSDESNFKMANDFLFSHVSVPSKNIHRIKGENVPEEEAKRYALEMNKNLNTRDGSPVFDLIILALEMTGIRLLFSPTNWKFSKKAEPAWQQNIHLPVKTGLRSPEKF
jgi:6-phosphogluconolactonase